MFSSAKRAHAIHPPVSPDLVRSCVVEMEMMPVPEDAMEAQPDVEMGTEPVRSGHKESQFDVCRQDQHGSMSGYCWWVPLPESDQNPHSCKSAKCFKWRRRYNRSSMQTVISTRMLHEAKRNRAQPSIVIPEYADAMRES